MKILNKMIILIIIIIFIILGLIFLIKQSADFGTTGDDGQMPEISIEEIFQTENKLQLIETKAEYFNIKKCIDTYKEYSKDGNKLFSIIPDFVKNEMGLNTTNVYENIGIPNKIIRIDSIYKSLQTISTEAYEESTNICAYIAEGYFIENNTYEKQKFKIIVLLDINNSTFLIIPQNYIEQKQINLNTNNNFIIYNNEIIEANQYNTFTYSSETAEDMSKEYFNRLKANLNYDLEYIYACLDTQYKTKRFGSYDNFIKYVKNNEQQLKQIAFNKYLVNYNKEYIEYVCTDQYSNVYIFKETAPMNFTLKLDTYTITTEKYKSEYENANEQQKVMMNVDKWIKMLNNRDYTAAYNLLDETFRNKNLGSQEKFEKYMRETYPLCYEVEFLTFSSEANIYIQNIKLTDVTNENKIQKELNIIMQLKDELDFVMSFNMN